MPFRLPPATLFALFFGLLLAGPADAAPGGAVTIAFDEIEARFHAASPLARMNELAIDGARAAQEDALQWSNPDLAYDLEKVGGLSEWQLTLGKSLMRPLARGDLQAGWSEHVLAAELRGDQSRRELLASLRAGYVQLRLLDRHLERVGGLRDGLDRVAAVATARHAEGELSGVASRLLKLSALAVEAAWREARQHRLEQEVVWRARLGIPQEARLELTTPVDFRPVPLAAASHYVDLLEASPGVRADSARVRSLAHLADASRPRLLPEVTVYGGYKQIEELDGGFVAGAALALPLFDQGAGAARELEAEGRIAAHEAAMERQRRAGEIQALLGAIASAEAVLVEFAARLDDGASSLDALLASYRGGALSLEGLLDAIQIEATALGSYHDQLVAYYDNLFRLEALTGASIVSLNP